MNMTGTLPISRHKPGAPRMGLRTSARLRDVGNDQQQGRNCAAGTEMNAKATFMAKLPSRRKTAALAYAPGSSCLPTRFRVARASNGGVFNSPTAPAQLLRDHDFLRRIGRSLVENSAHLDVIDVLDVAHATAKVGMAWSDTECVERAKEWKPCSNDGQSGANWNCARTERRRHGHPPRWAKETHCYAHI